MMLSFFPRRYIVFLGIIALALLLSPQQVAAGAPGFIREPGTQNEAASNTVLTYQVISGNPLTINVANDASYQVVHAAAGDPQKAGMVYSNVFPMADSGIFVATGNSVTGPDFFNHFTSSAEVQAGWVPVSQSPVSGLGTGVSPWLVETVVENTAQGVTLTTRTSYINGSETFGIDWDICLAQAGPTPVTTYLAADVYLQAEIPESSLGGYSQANGAVYAQNEKTNWFESLVPNTPATHYQAADFAEIWNRIWDTTNKIAGPGFNDTANNTGLDNGIGLQWDLSVDGCATVSAQWEVRQGAASPTPTPSNLFLPFATR